jgi:hypothetical protein
MLVFFRANKIDFLLTTFISLTFTDIYSILFLKFEHSICQVISATIFGKENYFDIVRTKQFLDYQLVSLLIEN